MTEKQVKVKSYERKKPAPRKAEHETPPVGAKIISINKTPRRTANEPLKIVSGNNPANTTSRDTIGVKVVRVPPDTAS